MRVEWVSVVHTTDNNIVVLGVIVIIFVVIYSFPSFNLETKQVSIFFDLDRLTDGVTELRFTLCKFNRADTDSSPIQKIITGIITYNM